MKAKFYLIAICIVMLPFVYFINGKNNHWSMIIPLGYLLYSFFVGCISWWNNRK